MATEFVYPLLFQSYTGAALMPILREQLLSQDWQRGRYLWARLGYTRVTKADADSSPVLSLAFASGATALHMDPLEDRLRFRLRIQESLHEIASVPQQWPTW